PKSLTELAELSGRKVPNLSRTLRMMADYGLVSLQRNVRDVQPTALATEFLVVLD
ncbi:TPA: transcriptional regulator, partial [Pseudomonas aeruginosa]|nr:transcriptional regulator [Pseudomonas aeruginosa]